MPPSDAAEPRRCSRFRRSSHATGWIVNIPECRSEPARYPGLVLPELAGGAAVAWLVVPLIVGQRAARIRRADDAADGDRRRLGGPRPAEDGQPAGGELSRTVRATEALLEARKFDAFNRMSAFVVHDLKNLVAQLSLMLRNAERHRDNPEFQRDMLTTVEHVVGRMNGLMLQLRDRPATPGRQPAARRRSMRVVRRVCAAKCGVARADRRRV